MTGTVAIGLIILGGYLLGSIPFGLLLTKLAGMGDIRAIGSGNIGATNVLRTGNKGLAAITLLLDGGKGALAVILAATLAQPWQGDALLWSGLAGLCAVIGHIFPVWLGFKGGKGVATALGVFVALAWPIGVACMITWLLIAVVFRISSMAALFAMALAPAYAIFWSNGTTAAFALVIAVLVIVKHRANISRMRRGEEPRIGQTS